MIRPLVELLQVEKTFGGLRPLRIQHLTIAPGERVAVVRLDAPAAEVLTNLITGAVLPDAGHVIVFGTPTAHIQDSDEWLASVDRFGLVSDRAVLLDGMTVLQNLALPFTLEIEPPPPDVEQLATAVAYEVGLPEAVLHRPVAELGGERKLRLRLGRALALQPEVLLLEHPTADVAREAAVPLGGAIRQIAEKRGVAVLALTADEPFADAVASRVLTHDPATGRLLERRRGGWFTRRRI